MSNHIVELLTIMDLAKQWPQFQSLHDIAMADLLVANEEAKVEIAKRAKVKAEKEEAIRAEAAAKAKAIAEAQAQKEERDKQATERARVEAQRRAEHPQPAPVTFPPEGVVERRE